MLPRLDPPLSTWAWPVRPKGMFFTTWGGRAHTYIGVARAPQGTYRAWLASESRLSEGKAADPSEKQIMLTAAIIIRESRLSEHDNDDGLDMFVLLSLPRECEFE